MRRGPGPAAVVRAAHLAPLLFAALMICGGATQIAASVPTSADTTAPALPPETAAAAVELRSQLAAANADGAAAAIDTLIATAVTVHPSADGASQAGELLQELGIEASEAALPAAVRLEFADKLLSAALTTRESLPPSAERSAALIETRATLADLAYERGHYDDAERHELEHLALLAGEGPAQQEAFANRLIDLAMIHFRQARFGDAEQRLVESRTALADQTEDNSSETADAATTRASLAIRRLLVEAEIRRVEDRLDLAASLIGQALDRVRAMPSPSPLRLANLLNNLAGVEKDRGNLARAELLLDEEASLLDDPSFARQRARSELNRGDVLRLQGRPAEAARRVDAAVEAARQALDPNNPALATFLGRAALIAADLGDPARAGRLADEGLVILSSALPAQAHPTRAQAREDRAAIHLANREPTAAQALLETVRGERRELFGDDHPEVARTTITLTRARWSELQARTDGQAQPGPLATKIVNELADEIAAALAILAGTGAFPEQEADGLVLAAELAEQTNQPSRARELLHRAVDLLETVRPQAGGAELVRAEAFARQNAAFSRLVSAELAGGDVAAAWAVSERARGRDLLDRLTGNGIDLLAGLPAAERTSLAVARSTARDQLVELQGRLAETAERRDLAPLERRRQTAKLANELDLAARRLQAIEHDHATRSPLWSKVLSGGGQPATPAQLASELLGPAGRLVSYHLGETASRAFIVDGRDAKLTAVELTVSAAAAATLGIPEGTLNSEGLAVALSGVQSGARGGEGSAGASAGVLGMLVRVRTAADLVAAPAGVSSLEARLQALGTVLVPAPLQALLTGAERLVVVADGPLARLPLEALQITADAAPRHWLEVFPPAVYAPSATVGWRLAQRTTTAADVGEVSAMQALLLADPNFALTTSSPPAPSADASAADASPASAPRLAPRRQLEPLPGTAVEVAAVRERLTAAGIDSAVLAGNDATEANLRRALASRPRLIHLATHGLVSATADPSLSGLALTPGASDLDGAMSPADDGFLQLFEISELPLAAELVVLSACDSAVGREVLGEGPLALARGFLLAGARQVIASRWRVDDDATAALMSELAAGLAVGASPERALAAAAEKLRANPRYAAPYFWAAFASYGAPAARTNPASTTLQTKADQEPIP